MNELCENNMATMREIVSWSLCTKCTKNELFNEKKKNLL